MPWVITVLDSKSSVSLQFKLCKHDLVASLPWRRLAAGECLLCFWELIAGVKENGASPDSFLFFKPVLSSVCFVAWTLQLRHQGP